MGKTIKAMIADTPLVKNLDDPRYVEILLAGQATLPLRFAQIEAQTVRLEQKKNRQALETIPLKIRQAIAMPSFLQEFTKLLQYGITEG